MKKALTPEQFAARVEALLVVWEDTACSLCGGPVCDGPYDFLTVRSRTDDFGRPFCGSQCLEEVNP